MGKDYENVAYFLEVVRAGSFSKAAQNLGVAVSTVRLAISQLEAALGSQVLLRIKKGVQMTDVGKHLFQMTDQPVRNIHDAIAFISSSKNELDLNALKKVTRKSLRILTTTGFLSLWILPKLEMFFKKYPHIKLEIETVDGEVNFTETTADVGIHPSVLDNKNVHKKNILTVNSRLFCSEEYIRQYGRPKSIEDLKNHKLIGYYCDKKTHRGDIDWHIHLMQNNSNPALVVNSAIAQIYAAKLGYGILSISDEYPYLDASFVDLFPDLDSTEIKVYFVTRRDAINDQSIDDLYSFLIM